MASSRRIPFEPFGVMSAVEACRQIIERIEAKDGITYTQAVDEVSELCEYQHVEATVRAAMRAASETMIADGVPGVVARPGFGWLRMDSSAVLRHGQGHLDKSRRAVVRAGAAANAADPEKLSWEERQQRDRITDASRRQLEIVGKRGRRLRPLPPAQAG